MPSCSATDLAEIRRSSKIRSWIWSIISGVVTVLCRPGRGASQVYKSPRLNRTAQFLTVAYVVGQLSSWTRHRVLAVAALDKSLNTVSWRWNISVSQLCCCCCCCCCCYCCCCCCCCCWSMAVPFWVASITVCVCFGVPPREFQSLN